MSEGNLAYYERRARQEAEAAAAAAAAEDQPNIASAHRLLAIQYEDRVRELSARPLEMING
jgi:hypothetical protein